MHGQQNIKTLITCKYFFANADTQKLIPPGELFRLQLTVNISPNDKVFVFCQRDCQYN